MVRAVEVQRFHPASLDGEPCTRSWSLAALAAGAWTIVSGDGAVLAVGGFAGVLVVSPAEFLVTLGEVQPES